MKAIFLDRDGTINEEKLYLYKIEDFEFIQGVVEALKILHEAGFLLIIITNQSGIARGFYTEQDFLRLNNWMTEELGKYGVLIDKVYYCPHHPEAAISRYRAKCRCRKPGLDLFYRAVKEFGIDLNQSYAIGDKLRDCAICMSSSCKGFLVNHTENETVIKQAKEGFYNNISYAETLLDCARNILREERK